MSLYKRLFSNRLYYRTLNQLLALAKVKRKPLVGQAGIEGRLLFMHKIFFVRALLKTLKAKQYPFLSPNALSREDAVNHRVEYTLSDLLLQHAVGTSIHDELSAKTVTASSAYIHGKPSPKEKSYFVKKLAGFMRKYPSTSWYVAKIRFEFSPRAHFLNSRTLVWNVLYQLMGKRDKERAIMCEELIRCALYPVILNEAGSTYCDLALKHYPVVLKNAFIHCCFNDFDWAMSREENIFYGRTNQFVLLVSADEMLLNQKVAYLQVYLAQHTMLVQKELERHQLVLGDYLRCLGFQVYQDGSIGLSRFLLEKLFNELREKLQVTNALLKEEDENKRGQLLSACCNRFVEERVKNSMANEAFYDLITNCAQIDYINMRLALLIAEVISGEKGRHAFKKVPGWKIDKLWKLKGLV